MLQAFISLLSIKLPSSTKRYLTDWRVWASFQQFNSKFQYESNSCQERKEILCCRLIPSSFSLLLQILRAKQSRLPTECHCGGKSSASLWSRFCALTRHVFYPRLGITSCLDSAWSLPPLCVGGGAEGLVLGTVSHIPFSPTCSSKLPVPETPPAGSFSSVCSLQAQISSSAWDPNLLVPLQGKSDTSHYSHSFICKGHSMKSCISVYFKTWKPHVGLWCVC